MFRIMRTLTASVAGCALAVGLASSAGAASDADLFRGKKIDVIIGSSPGGGTDGTTRLVGRFLEKYLPGNPEMVYRNMPAGHGVMAGNYFYNKVKPDGYTWFGGSSSYVDANNLRKKVVKYDPTKYRYIGGISRGGSVTMIRKAKLGNISDKSKDPVIVGSIDGSRSWAQMIVWGAEYLGWNVKFVIGYPGAPALTLASKRGEVDMFGTSNIELLRSMEKTGDFAAHVQIGAFEGGKWVPRAAFPNVDVMPQLMEGKVSGLAKEAFEYWTKTNLIDKWYALPPGTPDKFVEAYRAAFRKAFDDPEFIKYGKHQFSLDFAPQWGPDVGDLIRSTAYVKTEYLDLMRDLRVKHGLPATQLSQEEMAKLAEKRGGLMEAKTTLEDVKRGGRWLHFKADNGEQHKTRVSGSRTKVVIAGSETKRKNLKPGMKCTIKYLGNEKEARLVDCQ